MKTVMPAVTALEIERPQIRFRDGQASPGCRVGLIGRSVSRNKNIVCIIPAVEEQTDQGFVIARRRGGIEFAKVPDGAEKTARAERGTRSLPDESSSRRVSHKITSR